MATKINFFATIDGKCVVNTTPHPINFLNKEGETVIVPSSVAPGEKTSPWVVNARAVEEQVGEDLVHTVFVGTPEGEAILDKIEEWAREEGIENLRVIGSIVAAQAYPGRVLGMCPAPGFERVPPAEKRMTAQKFTVYGSKPVLYLVGTLWFCSDQGEFPNTEAFPEQVFASYEEANKCYEQFAAYNSTWSCGFTCSYLVRASADEGLRLLKGRYQV